MSHNLNYDWICLRRLPIQPRPFSTTAPRRKRTIPTPKPPKATSPKPSTAIDPSSRLQQREELRNELQPILHAGDDTALTHVQRILAKLTSNTQRAHRILQTLTSKSKVTTLSRNPYNVPAYTIHPINFRNLNRNAALLKTQSLLSCEERLDKNITDLLYLPYPDPENSTARKYLREIKDESQERKLLELEDLRRQEKTGQNRLDLLIANFKEYVDELTGAKEQQAIVAAPSFQSFQPQKGSQEEAPSIMGWGMGATDTKPLQTSEKTNHPFVEYKPAGETDSKMTESNPVQQSNPFVGYKPAGETDRKTAESNPVQQSNSFVGYKPAVATEDGTTELNPVQQYNTKWFNLIRKQVIGPGPFGNEDSRDAENLQQQQQQTKTKKDSRVEKPAETKEPEAGTGTGPKWVKQEFDNNPQKQETKVEAEKKVDEKPSNPLMDLQKRLNAAIK